MASTDMEVDKGDDDAVSTSPEVKKEVSAPGDASISENPTSKTPPCSLTGRGVTLTTLITEGIIEPGNKTLSIDYLGRSFIADLLPNGKIKTPATGEEFLTPSSWAMHCKQVVNPAKKSGCGWASVKYRGRKLDYYKNQWFRRQTLHRASSPTASEITNTSDTENSCDESEKPSDAKVTATVGPESRSSTSCSTPVSAENKRKEYQQEVQEEALNLCIHDEAKSREKPPEKREIVEPKKKCVQYSSLGKRLPDHDPSTLVETVSFGSIGKIQPFTASVTSNCMLVIDFHCHLVRSEVCGYLAGRFDPTTQHLSILQAFPCRCQLNDKVNSASVQEDIKQKMKSRGLWLMGWYHSHPRSPASPTLRDIDSQMEHQYQLTSTDNSYSPCFALIIAPYENSIREASFEAFWVCPPPENRPMDYAMPMKVQFSIPQDTFLTQDVITEMKELVDYYSTCADVIQFSQYWDRSWTYLDKIKSSLAKKLPKQQSDSGGVLQIVHSMLAR